VPKSQPVPSGDNGECCPKCNGNRCSPVPSVNPKSNLDWFKCEDCDHMWAVQRDGTRRTDR